MVKWGDQMRKVIYVEATDQFELVLIFDNEEYRILNLKEFFKNEHGLLAEIRDDLQIFQTVELVSGSSKVKWSNGGYMDSDLLYKKSRAIKVL
jgi:hypothetical protein